MHYYHLAIMNTEKTVVEMSLLQNLIKMVTVGVSNEDLPKPLA